MNDPLNYVARKLNRLLKVTRHRGALRDFRAVAIRPGDIAIDCGANVGEITATLADRGARVYAFEPNPIVFARLQDTFADHPRVTCLPAAVSRKPGRSRLYLHRKYRQDPLGHSAGSSLLASKRNLDQDRFVTVDVVDLADFIRRLGLRVRLLKLDIEGAEIAVLNHLIDTGMINEIDYVFCETHEYKIPGFAHQRRRLRRRLDRAGIEHVNLDWY